MRLASEANPYCNSTSVSRSLGRNARQRNAVFPRCQSRCCFFGGLINEMQILEPAANHHLFCLALSLLFTARTCSYYGDWDCPGDFANGGEWRAGFSLATTPSIIGVACCGCGSHRWNDSHQERLVGAHQYQFDDGAIHHLPNRHGQAATRGMARLEGGGADGI